jgi:hypothetical protein
MSRLEQGHPSGVWNEDATQRGQSSSRGAASDAPVALKTRGSQLEMGAKVREGTRENKLRTIRSGINPFQKSVLERGQSEHVVLFTRPLHRVTRLHGNLQTNK